MNFASHFFYIFEGLLWSFDLINWISLLQKPQQNSNGFLSGNQIFWAIRTFLFSFGITFVLYPTSLLLSSSKVNSCKSCKVHYGAFWKVCWVGKNVQTENQNVCPFSLFLIWWLDWKWNTGKFSVVENWIFSCILAISKSISAYRWTFRRME